MKEMLKRALRTFVQAFFGYIAVNMTAALSGVAGDKSLLREALIGLGVSAVAAGLAAVMNKPKRENKDG